MIAFLYAGQGAQYPGMGRDLAAHSPAAAQVFSEAAEVLGYDVTALDADELKRTDRAQTATFVHSLAADAALRALRPIPEDAAYAGFSLGEWTAFTAAGILDFRAALQLLGQRADFMDQACRETAGAMVAVLGLEDEVILAELCEERWVDRVFPANFNAPGQLVISGHEEAVLDCAAVLRQKGARRTVRLDVAGAFHSPLMTGAAERLRQAAAELEALEGRGLVMSSVYGEPLDGRDSLPDYLARQMTSPVRWSTLVRNLGRRGVDTWIEFGPGTVLSGLVKRQFRNHRILNVDDWASLGRTLEALPVTRL
ncbi:MAG: ACP S-malonyltransferase [Bacillota bacterium]|nr:ACP S-malonyltransferase [Bacillota bacterium]